MSPVDPADYRPVELPATGTGVCGHQYHRDDRCACGGEVVYFEDASPPGNGCAVEGKPWSPRVRLLDPQERRERRAVRRTPENEGTPG